MKKNIFTNNSDIRLGFEVECVIYNEGVTKFYAAIRNLNKGVSTGSDGSISYNGDTSRAVEIRTKPLPPAEAMEDLKKIFAIVEKFGYTNGSCGLHVNISSIKKAKMRAFNPLPFLSSKIWTQILRKFKRTSNGYCRSHLPKRGHTSKVHILKKLTDAIGDKYYCVTFCNWGTGQTSHSRIEIRGFGNARYTRKYQTIASFVKRIVKLFSLSCNNRPFATSFNV